VAQNPVGFSDRAERIDAKRTGVGHKVGGGAEKNALPGKDC